MEDHAVCYHTYILSKGCHLNDAVILARRDPLRQKKWTFRKFIQLNRKTHTAAHKGTPGVLSGNVQPTAKKHDNGGLSEFGSDGSLARNSIAFSSSEIRGS